MDPRIGNIYMIIIFFGVTCSDTHSLCTYVLLLHGTRHRADGVTGFVLLLDLLEANLYTALQLDNVVLLDTPGKTHEVVDLVIEHLHGEAVVQVALHEEHDDFGE